MSRPAVDSDRASAPPRFSCRAAGVRQELPDEANALMQDRPPTPPAEAEAAACIAGSRLPSGGMLRIRREPA